MSGIHDRGSATFLDGPILDGGWWLFCGAILLIKVILLGVDPSPLLFMGDSGSYLWTAISGWIPPDRSFLYGYVIRWVAIATHSLTSLLLLQVVISATTSILLCLICRQLFQLPFYLACAAGVACALDPLQLVWEHYVLTETISLFLYAITVALALSYLRRRRLWQVAALQISAVLLIAFRISYLPVVEASTILLPVIAFFPLLLESFQARSDRTIAIAGLTGLHLFVSLLLMFGLHLGYKEVNGFLAGRRPAYLYSSGFSILAAWAPVLQPGDAADRRLASIIADGPQYHLSDIRLRNSQLYSKNSLIDRWKHAEPDLTMADQLAKQTALHALERRPGDILSLGFRTFLEYFHYRRTHQQAKSDLGNQRWSKNTAAMISGPFRLLPPKMDQSKHPTPLQKYFLKSQPYYYLVILSPLLWAGLFWLRRDGSTFFLFVQTSILLTTDCLFAVTASVRYLQPLSLLTVLSGALLLNQLRYRQFAPLETAHSS